LIFFKSSFRIKNPILEIFYYDFPIQDFVPARVLIAILTFRSVEGSWKGASNTSNLGEKITN